jgi:hypothetical protein
MLLAEATYAPVESDVLQTINLAHCFVLLAQGMWALTGSSTRPAAVIAVMVSQCVHWTRQNPQRGAGQGSSTLQQAVLSGALIAFPQG